MTQNKKFKKQVRARMKQTGETYMQARRALLGDSQPFLDWPVYRPVGYWRSTDRENLPDPLDLVDASWDRSEREAVLAYLRGAKPVRRNLDTSWCRLGCHSRGHEALHLAFFEGRDVRNEQLPWEERQRARKEASRRAEEANMRGGRHGPGASMQGPGIDMGELEMSDGIYVWPDGLAHYIEEHNVRLPEEFVAHVLREGSPKKPPRHEPDEFVLDFAWWLRATNRWPPTTRPSALEPGDLDLDAVRRAVIRTWHEIYDAGSRLYHIYKDGTEDGRLHTSLCGDATTKTWETKTPGVGLCEMCQLRKVQHLLEMQKDESSPFHVMGNADAWAAAGGNEADRVKLRDEVWGPPPGERRVRSSGPAMPSFMEIESPFNPGWYYNDAEYPEEGSVGPYKTEWDAREAARLDDYDPDDPDSVTFWEQRQPAAVLRRFVVEHLRGELLTTLHEFAGSENTLQMQDRIRELMGDRLDKALAKLSREGIPVPGDDGIGMEFDSSYDEKGGVCQARIRLKNPERYPQLVRELEEVGLIEPRYLVSMKFKEAE